MRLSGLKNLLTERSFKKIETYDKEYEVFGSTMEGYLIKKIGYNNYSVRCINL